MADTIRVKVDVKNGLVEVEAPEGSIKSVFEVVENFIARLKEGQVSFGSKDDTGVEAKGNGGGNGDVKEVETQESKKKAKAAGKKSGVGPEPNKILDLGLDEGQQREMAVFYKEKNPSNQNDKVLVVAYWLLKNSGLEALNRHHIFSGIRAIGGIKVPARIRSRISDLLIEGRLVQVSRGIYKLHHTGEDYVVHELPKKSEAKV